ncbi:MAG: hypothetical protein WD824_14015 [Cyclobacteriaceae bacterium]
MKILVRLLAIAFLFSTQACEEKSTEALYNEVMDIHDDVMPKMNDLHKAKTTLQTRLAMPGTSETEKQEIDNKIAQLDSASEGMMVWMRQFNPLPDSAGEEKAKEYLEKELVKVKKVKENILKALEKTATN